MRVPNRPSRARSRRRFLADIALAFGGVALAACGTGTVTLPRPVGQADGPPTAPGGGASLVGAGAPPVSASFVDVSVTADSVRGFLQTALQEHEQYFAAVSRENGAAAAQQERDAVSAPYQARIAEMEARGGSETLRVPVITLWGAVTFSATSYEGPLVAKDPVSVLFFWDANGDRLYQRAIDILTCRPDYSGTCRRPPRFQDEDDRQGIPGNPFRCHTSPQWVLMGNAGGPLEWRKNVHGLMKDTDRCNRVGRDHIRIFGAISHPTLRAWSVATPHRERWSADPLPGRGGHIITSWNAAQQLFAGSWIESGAPGDRRGWDPSVFYWNRSDWGTGGVYQHVPFDGHGFIIGVDFPDAG